MSLTVSSARPNERGAALLLLLQHLPEHERQTRMERLSTLLSRGDIWPQGLLVCRVDDRLVGAMLAAPLEGAAALAWPPQVVAEPAWLHVEDLLVQTANTWLRRRGAEFAQALLPGADAAHATPLLRHGFRHITTLLYLQKDLNTDDAALGPRLHCQPYAKCEKELFHATLLESYENTLDCPELNNLRTIDEIVAGYRAVAGCRLDRWWLALNDGQPVGVLITMPEYESPAWELAYLGLVPAARRRGFGREMTRMAMAQACAAGALRMMLTVDIRNEPAMRLYNSLGFAEFERREVFLAVFTDT